MMIDLDNLKEINDTYGHHVETRAIRVLAAGAPARGSAPDTCGRLGGDEFGVAMPDADERDAREVGTAFARRSSILNRTAKLPVHASQHRHHRLAPGPRLAGDVPVGDKAL